MYLLSQNPARVTSTNHVFSSPLQSHVTVVIRSTDSAILPHLSLCLEVTRNVLTVMSFLLSIFTCHFCEIKELEKCN